MTAPTVSDVKVDVEELRTLLKEEVIKREVLEGEKAEAAHKKVTKSANKMLRIRKDDDEEPAAPATRALVPVSEAPKRAEKS